MAPAEQAPASPSLMTTTEALPAIAPARESRSDSSATQPVPMQPITAALPAAAMVPPGDSSRTSRPGMAGIIVIVVVLLAIVVIAALTATGTLTFGAATPSATPTSTPTPTVSPTPSVPAGFTSYSSPGYFSLDTPAEWTAASYKLGSTLDAVAFTNSSLTTQLVIEVFPSSSPSNLAAIDGQALTQLAKGKPIQDLQAATSVTVGGQSWEDEMANLPVQGTQSHVVTMATTRGAYLYLLYYFSPVNTFETASVADFQPMLNSFAFAS